MAIRFGNGFGIGASNNGGTSLSFFTNIEAITTYLKGYMSDYRNPDFYEYGLDGDGHYINDGGGDMMDNSNFTTPLLISNVSYSGDSGNSNDFPYSVDYNANGVGTIDTSFGFISLGYNNPTYLPLTVIGTRATIANPGTPIGFQCGGNIGADGGGTFIEGNIYTGDTVSGFTVHSYYRETYDAGDPSVCDVFILLGHPDWNSVFGDVFYGGDSSNQGSGSYLYTKGNGAQNVLAIKTLLSKSGGVEVTFSEVNTVVDNFIRRIKEAKDNLSATPTPTPTQTVTPTPSASPAPLSQYAPNGTTGSNGLLTYLNYTNGLDPINNVLLPDSSGLNHPYVWTGTNPYDVNVTGYTFVGGSTFAYAQDASNYNLGFSSLTIEMWVKIPSIPGSMSLLSAGANQGGGWALRVDGAGLQLNLVKYNIADQTVNLPTRLQADTWYHIVVAQGGSSLTYFVNGEIVGAFNDGATDNFSFTSGTVNIGKDYYTSTNTALTLGILRVYDYCLLTSDVVSAFDSTKTGYGFMALTPTPTPTTSSVPPTPTPTLTVTQTLTQTYIAPSPTATSGNPTPTPTLSQAGLTPTPTTSSSASAPMVVTINNSGSNVVMTATGTVNLSGLTLVSSSFGPLGQGGLGISSATFITGPNSGYGSTYSGFTSVPSNFGSGSGGANSSGSGDVFGVIFDMAPPYLLVVPSGYTSGANISSTQTFNNTSLSTLGLTDGTYTYTWSGGSLDVVVGGPAPTPTPTPSTGSVSAGWNFYEASGNVITMPPLSNGQALFYSGAPPTSTYNPNNVGANANLMFYKNDSAGTSYQTQFQNLVTNGGTISVTQNGHTATYTSNTPGVFYYDSGSGFLIFGAALQTATVASPFTYGDTITLSFS